MKKKTVKPKKVKQFTPKFKDFAPYDTIDFARIPEPQGMRFSPIDLNIAYKLPQLTQEEFTLYAFYSLVSGFDTSHHGLSDYSLREIASALKMSKPAIIRARASLSRMGLIAFRQELLENTRYIKRTLTQVLALDPADVHVKRRGWIESTARVYADVSVKKQNGSKENHVGSLENHHGSHKNQDGSAENFVLERRFSGEPPFARKTSADVNVSDTDRFKSVNASNDLNYLVEELVEELGDEQSLEFYRQLAEQLPEGIIREALGDTKYAHNMGRIRTSKGQYFTGLIKRYAEEAGKTWRK